MKNDKPDGYYDEVKYPFEKKDDIKAVFCEYEIIEHANNEEDYEYLGKDDVMLEIVNPNQNENLFIELAGEFTLCFSAWHSHYSAYGYDYDELKKDAIAIINGEYAALSFWINDEWFGATLLREEISHYTEPDYLISKIHFPAEFLKQIKSDGVVIKVDYWKPDDCYEFDVPSEQNCEEYSYPRRYGVRFIMKDGKCYGSASMKKYDDETAYISYMYIEEVDNADKLSASVIKHLEEDAKKAGMSRIFTNIEISEESLYTSLGYTETDRIDDDKVSQRNGAKVIFDKTMSKRLFGSEFDIIKRNILH
jgi:N-acetylglutamate synthase-like GNAT family acetyltransferase